MAINVHGYGRGGTCICKLTHAYVLITNMYVCIVYWIEVNLKISRQPLSTTPGLGPKFNPPVTLRPKLKSLPILSSVEHLSELQPCSPTRSKDNPVQRCFKFALVPVFYPPLKSTHASFVPHAPCPPSWIPSLQMEIFFVFLFGHLAFV